MIKNYSDNFSLGISNPIFIISLFLLFSCLINSEILVYSSLLNYFVFVIGSGVVLAIVLFRKYRTIRNTSQNIITLPFVLFLIWLFYVFIQSGEALQYKYYRLAACFVFLISFIVLRKNNIDSFYKAVILIAVIESLWCVLQYLGKIPSENINFEVTGSFSNPNVVAMFLALSFPASLYYCFKAATAYLKVTYYLVLFSICVGLILLECRTAIIGAAFSSMLFFMLRFDLINRYKRKYLLLVVLLVGFLCIPIARQLYLHKKDSADGRMLIWRISTQMILDSPLRGYGTGMFEKEYNLSQTKEIQEKKLSQSELKNASFVLMAYNDYLEQGVEGGLPAVLLFVVMLISFLYAVPKKTTVEESNTNENLDVYYVAYAGIGSFALMAFFNFILQAIPAMLLFSVYAGILCANNEQQKLLRFSIKQPIAKTLLFLSTCLVLYLTVGQLTQIKEYRKIKIAKDFWESGNVLQAENLLVKLQRTKQNSTSFCIIYGNLLFSQKRYREALEQFEYAKKFSATPVLFDMAAQCQFQLKNNKEAISNLYLLTSLSPKTIKYKFGLMQLLVLDKQIKQACIMAQQIVGMSVINANELTEKYQKRAKSLLRSQQKS